MAVMREQHNIDPYTHISNLNKQTLDSQLLKCLGRFHNAILTLYLHEIKQEGNP